MSSISSLMTANARNVQALQKHVSGITKSATSLSTGLRISKASIDPSGHAIGASMQLRVGVLEQAKRNVLTANSITGIGGAIMDDIRTTLSKMKELTVQANNDCNASERATIDNSFQALLARIDPTAESARAGSQSLLTGGGIGANSVAGVADGSVKIDPQWNLTVPGTLPVTFTASTGAGVKAVLSVTVGGTTYTAKPATGDNFAVNERVTFNNTSFELTLDGTPTLTTTLTLNTSGNNVLTLQASDDAESTTTVEFVDCRAAALGLTDLNTLTSAGAVDASTKLDAALKKLQEGISAVASQQVAFESAVDNLETLIENNNAVRATLQDVDNAAETANFAGLKSKVAAAAMMIAEVNQVLSQTTGNLRP